MSPVIHGVVTLRHFAAVGRMDILHACHGHRPEPRWTEGIRGQHQMLGGRASRLFCPYGWNEGRVPASRTLWAVKASRPPERLPEYERPPVVEVALAIEFDEPVGFRSLDLGRIAAEWSDDLPLAEERPPLPRMGPPTEELLDNLVDSLFELDSSALEEPPRLWLQNEVGDQVVQIQRDRLVVNWRKEGAGSYPRYGFVRDLLQDSWDRLTRICGVLGSEAPVPDLCEAQYVNHIGAEQGWNSPRDTARLIVPWHGVEDSEFLPTHHLCGFNMHCHFSADQEGWLDIDGWTTSVVSADDETKSERLVLNLTSRGHALQNDFESALEFFDVAHGWIVRGFTDVTSTLAHEIWGRTQ